jgi:hypothetical protein
VGYLASPAAENITGQVFVVYSDFVALLSAPALEQKFTAADGVFSVEELDAQITPYFEGRGPYQNFAAFGLWTLDNTGTSKFGS